MKCRACDEELTFGGTHNCTACAEKIYARWSYQDDLAENESDAADNLVHVMYERMKDLEYEVKRLRERLEEFLEYFDEAADQGRYAVKEGVFIRAREALRGEPK